jgi:hypothetical protein
MMRVIVFVTDDGRSAEGTGPMLVLRDDPLSALPAHPRSLAWRYYATLSSADQLFSNEREAIERSLGAGEPFISKRLVG